MVSCHWLLRTHLGGWALADLPALEVSWLIVAAADLLLLDCSAAAACSGRPFPGATAASLEEVDRRVTSWSGRSRSVAPPTTMDLKGSGRDAGRDSRGGVIPGGDHNRRFRSRIHLSCIPSLLTANDLGMFCASSVYIALTVLDGRAGRLVWQLQHGQRAARRAKRGRERRGVGRAAGHWTE